MELSQHVIDEVKKILDEDLKSLPAQITSAPHFFVTNKDDTTIQAFKAIKHNGLVYKVGTKKI